MKQLILLSFILSLFTITFTYADTVNTTVNSSQPIDYQVDLVIFKNIQGIKNVDPTQWQGFQYPNFPNAINLAEESRIPPILNSQLEFYQNLPKKYFLLKTAANRIHNSTLYQFIKQVSWFQPIIKSGETVLVTGGNHFTQNTNQPIWEMVGTIRLTSSLYQYFNLSATFILTEPVQHSFFSNTQTTVPSANPNFHSIVLHETRRIKAGQVNYLDSPGLGVLIKVVKLPISTSGNSNS